MEVSYICRICKGPHRKFRVNTRRSYKEWNYVDENGMRVAGRLCHACAMVLQQRKRSEVGNAATKRYEKTKRGFLMRLYRNMKSRVTGVQRVKFHLYEGKSLLAKQGFYDWAEACPEFHRLYDAYEAAGFCQALAPSVDRINSDLGYELGNMQWVTFSENSSRGAGSAKRAPKGRWKLTDAQAAEIKRRRLAGEPTASLAKEFGISCMHVYTVSRDRRLP